VINIDLPLDFFVCERPEMEWLHNFTYAHFLDKHVEVAGHLVSLNFSSPSAFWTTMHQRYQPFYIFFGLYIVLVAFYLVVGFFFAYLEHTGHYVNYKINPKATDAQDYKKCALNLILNFCLVIPFMNIAGWPALQSLGYHWSQEFPSLTTFVLHFIASMFLEDLVHYFLHRFLHIKALYPYVHKVHHEYSVPFALSGTCAHPIETAILGLATFSPVLIVKDYHMFTFYMWILYRSFDANIEHCGYDLTRNLHLPYYGGTRFHDKHHTSFNFNFASRFTYLDKLMGTYKEPDNKVKA